MEVESVEAINGARREGRSRKARKRLEVWLARLARELGSLGCLEEAAGGRPPPPDIGVFCLRLLNSHVICNARDFGALGPSANSCEIVSAASGSMKSVHVL